MPSIEIFKKVAEAFSCKLIYLSVDGSDHYPDACQCPGSDTVLSLMPVSVMETENKFCFH